MNLRSSKYTPVCLTLILSLLVGCAVIDLPDKLDLSETSDKVQRPVKMTALWSDTVLVEAGVAGFGGRIMFYGRGDEDPIKVEGELTVFAYDDTDDIGENTLPARKYVFRAEELEGHYSKSKLGHSYSFWIPWDRVGGPRRQVSLIARFKSKHGGVVMSEMTRHLLPGAPPVDVAQRKSQRLPDISERPTSRVMQATHVHRAGQLPPTSPLSMQTTTIAMSGALEAVARSNTQPLDQPFGPTAAAGTPQTAVVSPAGETTGAAARDVDPSQLRALVREAVQETLAANQGEQPADRFARRRPRARIAPKLPPTRDPSPTQLHRGALPSAPASTLQTVSPSGSATETSAFPGPTQQPTAPGR